MIDYNFIAKLEGNSLIGYVPDPEHSKSGVTIASGFDLGQRHVWELADLDPLLVTILAPYCRFVGQDAVELLDKKPLSITNKQAKEINEFAHADSEQRIISLWQEWSMIDWYDLTDRQQTVVASVAFQYGDLSVRTPNFWRQVISGKWGEAVINLRNFGDRYPTRRNKEADYLCNII